jgi:DNA-binding transcriptional LysR family regulator
VKNLSHFDLNGLMLFYETVNARSINKASQRLEIPKSTISRRLRSLEEQFNSALLKRGSQSLDRVFWSGVARLSDRRAFRLGREWVSAPQRAG